jgi:hypothetical protein
LPTLREIMMIQEESFDVDTVGGDLIGLITTIR